MSAISSSDREMIVTVHQPDFLPWLGFFDRWYKSELYIVLDNVQFLRRGWHHRDKIKTLHGLQWLTVPVLKKGNYEQSIADAIIDDRGNWQHKHLNTLAHVYGKAPNFPAVFAGVTEIYGRGHERLIDLNMDLLLFCAEQLGITTPVVLASTLDVRTTGTQRLVDLMKGVNGNVYLTGLGSKRYLDQELFHEAGIEVRWQRFKHPVYPQLQDPFEKDLSVLDFLMMRSSADPFPRP